MSHNGNECPNGHPTAGARGTNLGCTHERCEEPERCPEGHVTLAGCTRAKCHLKPTVNLRVAFAGASGTGKTTLARYIADLYGLEMNPVGSRSVAGAMGFASPYEADQAGRRAEFQQRLMEEKLAWEAAHECFVTDRTPLDNLAYTALHDVGSIDDETIRAATKGFWRYDVVFFTPLGHFYSHNSDQARLPSLDYHRIYEALLEGLLLNRTGASWMPPLVKLVVGNLDQRKDLVDRALMLRALAKTAP